MGNALDALTPTLTASQDRETGMHYVHNEHGTQVGYYAFHADMVETLRAFGYICVAAIANRGGEAKWRRQAIGQ